MTNNPYAAPRAQVADERTLLPGNFGPDGRGVSAGRGWDWIASAWHLFRAAPWLWIAITVVFVVGVMVLNVIPFGSLAVSLLWPAFAAGFASASRSTDQGAEIRFADFFAGFSGRLGPLIAVGAISLAISVVVFVVVFALMGAGLFSMMSGNMDPDAMKSMGVSLLLAGLISLALLLPLTMAVWFAPVLVFFHDMPPLEAMKASFFGCLKNVVPFLVYGVILFFAMIVAAIPFGLGYLVLIPVIFISDYTSYRDIYFSE